MVTQDEVLNFSPHLHNGIWISNESPCVFQINRGGRAADGSLHVFSITSPLFVMAGAATGWNLGMISGRDNGKAEDVRGAEMEGERTR